MGNKTSIEWTDKTWNPWQGCRKVSTGCKNCYMYSDKKRYGQDPAKIVRSKTVFKAPNKWKESALVFVCSWSDFFIEDADEWRNEAWEIIRNSPHLTFQILTKRPENIKDRLPLDWPLDNVWLGVTAENQEMADKRIPILLSIPANVHFVSIEPMIGPVSLKAYHEIDWVICGGESGPGWRPMEEKWATDLMTETERSSSTYFFMKQMENRGTVPDFLDRKEFPEVKR